MARLMVREGKALLQASMAEDWLLLAGSLVTAARVAAAPWVGNVGTRWVWVFAAICAAYLAVKGFRHLESRTDEERR